MSMNESQLGSSSRKPKPLGPGHLRIVEVDFLKPTSRNDGARDLDMEAAKTAARLLEAMRDGGWE